MLLCLSAVIVKVIKHLIQTFSVYKESDVHLTVCRAEPDNNSKNPIKPLSLVLKKK